MSKLIKYGLLSLVITLTGCAGVTITETGQADFRYRPHYEESKHFFLWGFIGEHHVDVRKICRDRPVKQMQSKFTATNLALMTLTAGLYVPRTARVWCELENEQ